MFPKKVILMCYCLVIVLHYLLVADNLAYAYYSGIRSDFQVPKHSHSPLYRITPAILFWQRYNKSRPTQIEHLRGRAAFRTLEQFLLSMLAGVKALQDKWLILAEMIKRFNYEPLAFL